jgi:ligand-binding sensor domain-containing protein
MNVLVQRNGRTWVYGMPFFAEWKRDSGGFTLINNELRYEQSLYFDHVVHSFEDRENNIWMATDNGVYVFNPDAQVFNTFTLVRPGEAPLQPPVQAIAETNNKIFVGCWGLGIYCFDKNFNPVPVPTAFSKHKYSYMSVWDMAINKKNNTLWIGEQGGTLDVYDIKKNTLTELQPDIFQHSTIRQIDEDTSGNIWFGTNHGRLIKWDFKKSGGDPAKGYELIF